MTVPTQQNTAVRLAEANLGFEPIVFESTGGLESGGRKVLESMLADVALHTDADKHKVIQRVRARISIDLQRSWHRSVSKDAYYAHWEAGVGGI